MRVMIDHLSGSKSGRKEAFDRESVLIGRGRSNDVSLDPFLDATVSSQHAEIRLEDGVFVLYDMGSLNGTYLNGSSVRRATLKDGDEISLGREGPRLVFRHAENARSNGGGDIRRALRRITPHKVPSTSMEMEMPRLNEKVVSSNLWLYAAAAILFVVAMVLLWQTFGG